jgi:hypothetical protein
MATLIAQSLWRATTNHSAGAETPIILHAGLDYLVGACASNARRTKHAVAPRSRVFRGPRIAVGAARSW